MQLRYLAPCVFALLVAPGSLLGACSATSPVDATPVDGGGGDSSEGTDSNTILPQPDSGPGDDAGDDGSAPLVDPGNSLRAGDVSIVGVTSDSAFVAYAIAAGTTTSLEVVAVAGGTPTVLAASLGADDWGYVDGKVVAFWTGVDKTSGIGTLGVWTAAGGLKSGTAKDSYAGIFAASADGTRIAYSTNAPAVAKKTDITMATSTMTDAVAITARAVTSDASGGCDPDIGFAGNRLLSATCTTSSTSATVASYDGTATPPVWTKTQFLTAAHWAPAWSADTTGATVFVRTPAGDASVFTVPANAETPISTGGDVASGRLTPDGTAVIYRTKTFDLKRAATTAPAPVIVASPAGASKALLDVSPDQGFVITYSNPPDTANADLPRIDLELAPAATAGAPHALVTLLAASTGAPVGFTSTSSHVVYMTDLPSTGSVPIGTLKARPTAGGAEVEIGKKALSPSFVAATTKLVFGDNVQNAGTSTDPIPVVDVHIVDLSTTGAPALVVDQTDPGFIVSGKKLFHVRPGAGLFVKDLP